MSKPIDQERELFVALIEKQGGLVAWMLGWDGNRFEYPPIQSRWETWQARAALQPAGVAVPEGWKLVPVEPTDEMLQSVTTSKHEALRAEVMRMAGEDYRAMLAAAPHPVSGEQKPDALRKRFSDIEDEIMAGKHNAASVFTAMRTAALYIGQPAAQDVAGLVEALEQARLFIRNGVELGYIRMPDADTPDPAHDTLPMIDAALAAHRAQQGEQPMEYACCYCGANALQLTPFSQSVYCRTCGKSCAASAAAAMAKHQGEQP